MSLPTRSEQRRSTARPLRRDAAGAGMINYLRAVRGGLHGWGVFTPSRARSARAATLRQEREEAASADRQADRASYLLVLPGFLAV